jgi:hypothetical protein
MAGSRFTDRAAFGGMHRWPPHHRGVDVVPAHNGVDHHLNNNRIVAGLSPPRSVREGVAMSNGRSADPVRHYGLPGHVA